MSSIEKEIKLKILRVCKNRQYNKKVSLTTGPGQCAPIMWQLET